MARPELPSLSDEEQQTIASMCQDALFAAWNDDSSVEDINHHLRQLWETALRIGLKHGQEEAKAICRKEDHVARAAVAKEMEQERVWGYDVGWKLCYEDLKARAQKASTIPLFTPPPRSLSVATTQTDAVAVTPVVAAVAAAPAPLDWAEDAETLPTSPMPPPSQPVPSSLPPRDFSALSTGLPQPFASLQHRHRRSSRPTPSALHKHSPQCRAIRRPQQKSGFHYAATRQTPPLYSHLHPTPPSPSDTPVAQFPLNWDQDPGLRDLGQALAALGWVRL